MRGLHCTVATALIALWPAPATRRPNRACDAGRSSPSSTGAPPSASSRSTVTRTPDGYHYLRVGARSGRRSASSPAGLRPGTPQTGGRSSSSSRAASASSRSRCARPSAAPPRRRQFMEGGASSAADGSDSAANAIFLPNMFFGGVRGHSRARLPGTKAGDQLAAYRPTADDGHRHRQERHRRPGANPVGGRCRSVGYELVLATQRLSAQIEMWADASGRMLRLTVVDQAFDVVRADIASVAARRVTISRANDEQVTIPANGFSLAGTISKPLDAGSAKIARPSCSSGDRARPRRNVAGIPIFGQLASALADGGFSSSATTSAAWARAAGAPNRRRSTTSPSDARAVVKFLGDKDVDNTGSWWWAQRRRNGGDDRRVEGEAHRRPGAHRDARRTATR